MFPRFSASAIRNCINRTGPALRTSIMCIIRVNRLVELGDRMDSEAVEHRRGPQSPNGFGAPLKWRGGLIQGGGQKRAPSGGAEAARRLSRVFCGKRKVPDEAPLGGGRYAELFPSWAIRIDSRSDLESLWRGAANATGSFRIKFFICGTRSLKSPRIVPAGANPAN